VIRINSDRLQIEVVVYTREAARPLTLHVTEVDVRVHLPEYAENYPFVAAGIAVPEVR